MTSSQPTSPTSRRAPIFPRRSQTSLEDSQFELRPVVSSFIFPPSTSSPSRVLLFRRSQKVHTYQGKFAPISGSISKDEGDTKPEEAAWREMREETRLSGSDLELWRKGKPFSFTDENAPSRQEGKKGRRWVVHPFAFRLKDEDAEKRIEIDWEHEAYEWVSIDNVLGGKRGDEYVPRLDQSLRRVLLGTTSPALEKGIRALKEDHEHGARELATMAVRTLGEIVAEKERDVRPGDVDAWWRDIREKAWFLVHNSRESMDSGIGNAVVRAFGAVKKDVEIGGYSVKDKVRKGLNAAVKERGELISRVGDRFAGVLSGWYSPEDGDVPGKLKRGNTDLGSDLPSKASKPSPNDAADDSKRSINILTLSSSSTIKSALLASLSNPTCPPLHVHILESRPLYEGIAMARSLLSTASKHPWSTRLKITLAPDSAVAVLAKNADILLLGADRISETGDVSNKTGSLPAVLAAKEITAGKVVTVVVSELEKVAGPGAMEEHGEEDNDPREVTDGWVKAGVVDEGDEMARVRNVYFEWVPARYVDCYVCETGFLTKDDIGEQSRRVRELEEEMFGDL